MTFLERLANTHQNTNNCCLNRRKLSVLLRNSAVIAITVLGSVIKRPKRVIFSYQFAFCTNFNLLTQFFIALIGNGSSFIWRLLTFQRKDIARNLDMVSVSNERPGWSFNFDTFKVGTHCLVKLLHIFQEIFKKDYKFAKFTPHFIVEQPYINNKNKFEGTQLQYKRPYWYRHGDQLEKTYQKPYVA